MAFMLVACIPADAGFPAGSGPHPLSANTSPAAKLISHSRTMKDSSPEKIR
jgi:hypothetical protein